MFPDRLVVLGRSADLACRLIWTGLVFRAEIALGQPQLATNFACVNRVDIGHQPLLSKYRDTPPLVLPGVYSVEQTFDGDTCEERLDDNRVPTSVDH